MESVTYKDVVHVVSTLRLYSIRGKDIHGRCNCPIPTSPKRYMEYKNVKFMKYGRGFHIYPIEDNENEWRKVGIWYTQFIKYYPGDFRRCGGMVFFPNNKGYDFTTSTKNFAVTYEDVEHVVSTLRLYSVRGKNMHGCCNCPIPTSPKRYMEYKNMKFMKYGRDFHIHPIEDNNNGWYQVSVWYNQFIKYHSNDFRGCCGMVIFPNNKN